MPTTLPNGLSKQKDKSKNWPSDNIEEIYCKNVWEKTLEDAGIEEDDYINYIFAKIHDLDKKTQRNKNMWKFSEISTIIGTAFVSFINVIAATNPNILFVPTNIIAAIIAAILTVVNGVAKIYSNRELWLRHSKFRADLILECNDFATDCGEYKKLNCTYDKMNRAKIKIDIFKQNTSNIIKKDYQLFFANMNKEVDVKNK